MFDTDSDTIKHESDALLEQVASVLNQHRGVDFVEVAGHADKRGDDARNRSLTQRRAEAVMKRLASLGVAPTRLRAVGYAAYCPLDPGDTEQALEANRRVELKILRRDGRDLSPAWGGCDGAMAKGMKPAPIPGTAPKTTAASAAVPATTTGASCEPPLTPLARKLRVVPLVTPDTVGRMSLGSSTAEGERMGIANAEQRISEVQSRLCSSRGTSEREVRDRRARLESLFRYLGDLENKPGAKLDVVQRQLSVAQALLEGGSQGEQQVWNVAIAKLLRQNGLPEEAIALYRKIIATNCGHREVYHAMEGLSISLFVRPGSSATEFAEAEAMLRRVIAERDNGPGSSVYSRFLLGFVLDKQGKRAEAITVLREASRIDNDAHRSPRGIYNSIMPDWAK